MKTKLVLIVVMMFTVFVVEFLGYSAAESRKRKPLPKPFEVQANKSPQEDKSPQEIRVENLINTATSLDFDGLVNALSENGENYGLICVASISSGFGPPVHLKGMVVDPRVGRLFQILSEMPANEAEERISHAYQEKLAEFKERWEVNGVLQNYQYGMEALLFLCEEFCSYKTFDDHCSDWLDWYFGRENPTSEFENNAGPQALLVINLYAIAAMRDGASVESVKQQLALISRDSQLRGLPRLTTAKLWKPDAREGKDSEVLKEFPIYATWGPASTLKHDFMLQQRVVSKVRRQPGPRQGAVEQLVVALIDYIIERFTNPGAPPMRSDR